MESWWIDELAYAGAEHLSEDYVERYDAKAQFEPADDVAALRSLGVGPSSVVLDMGAGTGTFALAMAPHCARVVAVELSPAMVARMRTKVDQAGVGNVKVVQAGILSYEHEGPPVDAVFSRNVLHQIPDFWKGVALDRAHRLLRPGGILCLRDLVYDFDPHEAGERLTSWMAGAVDDPTIGYAADDLAEHTRTEHSTYRWLFEALLQRVGFEVLDRSYRRSVYAEYTCRRQDRPGHGRR